MTLPEDDSADRKLHRALDLAAAAFAEGLQSHIVDFDDHFDDVEKDPLNEKLATELQALASGSKKRN